MKPLRIFLVEDNLGDQKLFAKALAGETQLQVFGNGETALDHLYECKNNKSEILPHLIVLDINLPGMTGLEVLEEIKKDEALSGIPLVIFSGANSDPRCDKADCCLVKANELKIFFKIVSALEQYGKNMMSKPTAKEEHVANLINSCTT